MSDRPDLDDAISILQAGGFRITGGKYGPTNPTPQTDPEQNTHPYDPYASSRPTEMTSQDIAMAQGASPQTPGDELEKQILEYFWPQPFPRYPLPDQVAISNGMDDSSKVFVVGWHAFKTAVKAISGAQQRQLLEGLKERLPKKYAKPLNGPINTADQEFGMNYAIDQVTALLDAEIRRLG